MNANALLTARLKIGTCWSRARFALGVVCMLAGAATDGPCASPANDAKPARVNRSDGSAHASALAQRAYVWQRAWSPELVQSVRAHAAAFAALDVLVAEVSFTADRPRSVFTAPPWAVLRETGSSIGLVVRIGAMSSAWARDAVETREVVSVCRAALAKARAARLTPTELQLDFDAATSRLASYRLLLEHVRREVAPPRLVFTALPDGLNSPAFSALAAAADAFVLQVHSLEKPRAIAEPITLCDIGRARAWIARAEQLGHPFRIALPTYGYVVGFDRDGAFAGLQAEGPQRAWPAGTQRRIAWSDATALAGLVAELREHPPAHAEAISWFRFPSDDDRLAWRWSTLRAVMHGQTPRTHLTLDPLAADDGSTELVLTNTGDVQVALAAFRVRVTGGRLLAGDGIDGWRFERTVDGAVLRPHTTQIGIGVLWPGERRHVGWVRLSPAATCTLAPL